MTTEQLTGSTPSEAPSSTYVTRLLWNLRMELDGLHHKIDEVEKLRAGEDVIALSSAERRSGLDIHLLLASDLIEAVKASLTTNPPTTHITPHRIGDPANRNSDTRERFWTEYLKYVDSPVPMLSELADSQLLGIGILKSSYVDYPKFPRLRRQGEKDRPYVDRVTALKKQWGPPFESIGIHPLSYYFHKGQGNRITESIEHSWKPRLDMYRNYGLKSTAEWQSRSDKLLRKDIAEIAPLIGTTGHPDQYVRGFPQGISTNTMSLVTEYWSPEWYQVYLDRRLVYQEENAPVNYFVAVGKSSSSTDPDKFGIGVAEYFRLNEPIINRTMTRMAEAVELIVRKRLTLELPEGSTDGVVLGLDNNPVAATFQFRPDGADALPAGAKVRDPYEGVDSAFAAMPFLQLLLQMAEERGVNPLFKGVSSAANASGYNNNSLYLMAKSQYAYMLAQYSSCLAQWVSWLEWCLVNVVREPIYCNGLVLRPSDVDGWPATVEVRIEPSLPQNRIAEGQFMSNMWKEGHVPRRVVVEDGLGYNQPSDIIRERLLEDVQDALIPTLINDVLTAVRPPTQPAMGDAGSATAPPGTNPLEGVNGAHGPGGIQSMIDASRNGNPPEGTTQGQAGESLGGMTRAGQSRQPPVQAGSFPATTTRGA